MRAPTVSIIMNCYNSATYLRKALESVVAQSYKDWEVIFWDNQSTDGSAAIFDSFNDTRLRYFRAAKHTRLGEARNLAVAQAKGSWLAFLDCDDEWTADKLKIQLREAEESGSAVGIVYGPVDYEVTSSKSHAVRMGEYYRRIRAEAHSARSIYHELLEGNFIIFSTLLIRRDIFIEVGGINNALSQNEDYELVLKASRISDAVCVEGVCGKYRIHDSNNSQKQAEQNFLETKVIFNELPVDADVERAQRMNATRFALYKIQTGDRYSGVKMLFSQGSLVWAVKRSIIRIMQRLN